MLRPGASVRLLSFVLLGLAAGCGGDGGNGPTTLHPTKLTLVTQPSTQGQSRVNLASQPVVQLQDDAGTAVPQAGVAVVAAIAAGGGSLIGTTTVNTASDGRATFTGLALRGLAGPHTLTFTSGSLAPVTSGTIDVTAGAASTIAVNDGNGQNAGTGNAVRVEPSVVVTDADNNRVAGVPVTFQVTAGGGTVDPTTPINTDANGLATVTSWTLGATPGPNSLSASASGLTGSPVAFGATGIVGSTISGTITVSNSLMARTLASIPRLPRSKRAGSLLMAATMGLARRPPLRRRTAEYTPDELIVTFRAGSLGAPPLGSAALTLRSSAAAAGAGIRASLSPYVIAQHVRVTGVSPAILTARVRVADRGDLKRVAGALAADPAVTRVSRNAIMWGDGEPSFPAGGFSAQTPNDPFYAAQAWHYGMIDAPEAWSVTTGSNSVLVAVIDDGIRFDHPAIAANLTSDGYDFVSNSAPLSLCPPTGGTIDRGGDGDGYDDDPTIPASYNYDADQGCLGALLQVGNHGLHVAGTIGAVGNDALSVTGINWSVRIRPVRALDVRGSGNTYDLAQAVLYAAGLPADDGAGGVVQAPSGAKIINMSLGGPGDDPTLAGAVTAATNAGSLIVSAAGNSASSEPHFPAAYPEVISVSAVGPDRLLASYSNFGSTVDIAAPGGDAANGDATYAVMSSTWNFATGTPNYSFQQGTSMATPHVAGVAALILAANPGLSVSQLRSRLLDFAVDVGAPGRDDLYGAGVVNARNSLAQNFAPPRQLRARLYDAVTGSIVQTVSATAGGAYSFTGVLDGEYNVFAGQDESGDDLIGLPGRRWGAFGGSASPTSITVSGPGSRSASFSVGFPSEDEPNGTQPEAGDLPVGGYIGGTMSPTDVDVYRVVVPQNGQYTFQTFPVDGACGFALEEDTVLEVLQAGGAVVASNDDIEPDVSNNFCSRVTTTVAAGTYYVRVEGLVGGTYRLQARAGS